MLNSKSFLTVDFGAGSLKLAEFDTNETGGLSLKQYGVKPLGLEGSQETTRESVMQKALQELLAEKGIKAKNVNVCAPGSHVFSKFVKLPPVDTSKVTQIIQYEAQQNVPFPLAEVVWDYQILGSTSTGELEVLLVAIKADIVEGLFRVTESAGLRLQLADVSPASLCNAFRYNYSDVEECVMLLDIGAKTSNLLFFEKNKIYSRSINLGANSITQDFANESKLPFPEAEAKKIAEGFVSLGGAYEEPENPHQAAISKIARQFMTRLHIQVNQTMQFYRGQQGGSAPQRLYLSGGASVMPYTPQFFAEKLNLQVEYFNPFRNVQIDPAVNLEELARVAHAMGEAVGLGLRNLAHCPVELNLMPASTKSWVQFNQKKPYFFFTLLSLVAVVFLSYMVFGKLTTINQEELGKLNADIQPLLEKEVRFNKAMEGLARTKKDAEQLSTWIDDRYYWPDVLTELHRILIQVEAETGEKLHTSSGVWIDKFISNPVMTAEEAAGQGSQAPPPRRSRNLPNEGGPGQPEPSPAPSAKGPKGSANDISVVTVTFRSVNLANSSIPSANTDIAYAVERALKESPFFSKEETQLAGTIDPADATGTFTFGVKIKLKRPVKL